MKARILTFSSVGDTTLLEYDPATADMEQVNRVIAEYEAKTGAQPFDMAGMPKGEQMRRMLQRHDRDREEHRKGHTQRRVSAGGIVSDGLDSKCQRVTQ